MQPFLISRGLTDLSSNSRSSLGHYRSLLGGQCRKLVINNLAFK